MKFRGNTRHKTILTCNINCKFREVSKTTVRFHNSLEGLIELTESRYTHSYVLLQEKYRLKSAKGRHAQGVGWESTKQSFCGPFLVESGRMLHFPSMDVWWYTCGIANQGRPLVSQYSKFLLELHYIGMNDWLPTWLISVSRSVDPKAPTLNHIVTIWLVEDTKANKHYLQGKCLTSSRARLHSLLHTHPLQNTSKGNFHQESDFCLWKSHLNHLKQIF